MIQIKHRFTASVLFEADLGSLKLVLQAAVKAKADLGGADLRGAYLRGAYLRGAYLGGAYLRGADLGGAYLRGADLGGADLRGADLRGADLGGAYLGGAYLRGAYLGGAYLRGAYLGGAYLRGAYLRGAYLGGAYLRGADLGGAYLRGADLIDAGQDSRGYRFVAVQQKEGPYIIFAGCHAFTLKEAKAHWKAAHADDPALAAECTGKVKLIKTVAKARGWESKGEKTALGPKPDDADRESASAA